MPTETSLIDSDIRRAQTLPSNFYSDPKYFELSKEKIFTKFWQFVGDSDRVKVPGTALPITMLPGYLDEPLVVTRDDKDNLHCLSNVCTHRGNLLVEGECHVQSMRCRYHGRRFGLNGCFLSTPGFEGAVDFPSAADDLPHVPFGTMGKFMFAAINPVSDMDSVIGQMQERLSWMPFEEFVFDPALSRDYIVQANWTLYCENYLEGFHIPYVHPALAAALNPKDYTYELYPFANLQIGTAASPGDAFDIPKSSPDHGRMIAAYYFWLFPNMMFNFYPWGLSVNVVVPLAQNRSKICYLTYVWNRSKLDIGAGANVDRTEREDEDIVEKVQLGVKSRFYKRGRYSPEHEQGVHHFHQLLTKYLGE